GFIELLLRQEARLHLLVAQIGQNGLAHALDGGLVEMRAVQRVVKQRKRQVAIGHRRLERTVKRIASDPETHRDGIGVERVLERFGIALARAFVEKRRQQIADTLLAFGIELGAALDRELQRDDRHGRILYRPDRQARRRFNFLYIQIRLCLHRKRYKQRKCKEKLFHLTFSGVRTAIRTDRMSTSL